MADIVQTQDTRRECIDVLCELAAKDNRIVFIVPDVGFNYAEKFQRLFPDRYFNFGVTEQSTMIVAAAMALDGYRPFVYSMINFVAFRPFEMVRNAISMHRAPVTLLGVKGSEKYKFLGFSHNMLFEDEDTYHLKPYLDCYIPHDTQEVRANLLSVYEQGRPAYIRL